MSMYWFKCWHCTIFSTVFPVGSKNVWTTREHGSSFIKKPLKKQSVYKSKKLSIVYYCSLTIIQNKLFVFRKLLNFTTKFIRSQIKVFVFL